MLSRRSTPEAFRRAAAVAEQGTIDLASLVTLRVPLGQALAAFDVPVGRTALKVIVEPDPAEPPVRR